MRFYQPQYPVRKNRLTLGEGDFSYAEALCRKHPQLVSKIITTEYRNRDALEKEYDTHQPVIITNIKKQHIKSLANNTTVLLGEKGRYTAYLVLNGAFIKPDKHSLPYVFPTQSRSSARLMYNMSHYTPNHQLFISCNVNRVVKIVFG